MRIIFVILVSISTLTGNGQRTTERTIVDGKHSVSIEYISTSKRSISSDVDCFWLDAGTIRAQKGSSQLSNRLHGSFEKRNQGGLLLENGFFHHGMKTGRWMHWDEEGLLLRQVQWRHGKQHGLSIEYDSEGAEISRATYKAGKMHGRSIVSTTGEGVIVRYRNGEVVPTKTKTLRPPRIRFRQEKPNPEKK